jgi:Domain of unknown function (DUF1844)
LLSPLAACYDFCAKPKAARQVRDAEVPVSKEGKEIKITDKRMFTADGELREEYRFLDDKSTAEPPAAAGAGAAPAAPASETGPAGPAGPAVAAAAPPRRETAPPFPADAASAPGRGAERSPRSSVLTDPADPEEDFGDELEPSARLELPGTPPGLGPSFYDLAALLAEPVPVYLGDVELPDGQSAENIEMARLYIDLLDVLRQKTAGNLTAQESAFLEDLLYRLRVRYVQKRG